jgi:NitT/TauT family transport system permease protein
MQQLSPRARELIRNAETYVLPFLAFSALLLIWHFGVIWSETKVFPSPRAVIQGFEELYEKGLLWKYASDSVLRVAAGYLLAIVLGIPTGLLMGWYPDVMTILNPVMQMLRPISPIAWIPLAIIFFGVTNAAPIFLVFLAAYFPVVVSATTGVRNVPPMYLRGGANFGLNSRQLLWRVVLPSAVPQILTGLRISLGVAWIVVVAAEMIAVDSGLGYLVIDARNAGKRYDLVVAAMIMIGAIGLALDVLMRRTETLRAVRWGFRTESR